jgi:signal peptidase I
VRPLLTRMRRSTLFEVVFTVVVAAGLALTVQAYAVKPYRIPSASMQPTLKVGQRVIVDRFSHRLGTPPKVGEIIVFHPPSSADDQTCANSHQGEDTDHPCGRVVAQQDSETFIKRVVAVGGDTIAVRNGHVIRNGRRASEPFIAPCDGGAGCDFPKAIRVPKGHVFLMGDNRGESDDSRFWGPIPISWVIGRAFATYWPPDRIGGA